MVRGSLAGALMSTAGLLSVAGSDPLPEHHAGLDGQAKAHTTYVENHMGGNALSKQFFFPLQVKAKPKYIEPEVSKTFRSFKGHKNHEGYKKREKYLDDSLELINPHLLQESHVFGRKTALSEFNKKHDMNFKCISVRGKPCEFVLFDMNYLLKSGVGKTNVPRRLAVTLNEAYTVRSKRDVMNLLERKLQKHNMVYVNQNKKWNTPFRFNFPKNNGACMISLVLNPKKGMHTDVAYFLDVYNKEFGMAPYSLSVSKKHSTEMDKALKEYGYGDLRKAVTPATQEAILGGLESSLRRAVDNKKGFFVFHYLVHGSKAGQFCAEDQRFDPSEISKILSKEHNGRPLCEQIDIYIQAGSCYSGKQIRGIVDYFKQRPDIPVRNLYLVSESDETTATFSSSWQEVSLVFDNPIVSDMTGPQAYYDCGIKDYANYLKSQGHEIRDEVYTMLWRLRVADLFSWYDESQDMIGIHYSNNPNTKTKSPREHRFTQAPPESGRDLQYALSELEDRKDLVPNLRWNQYLANLRQMSQLS